MLHGNTIAIKQDMYAPHSNKIAVKQDMYAPHRNTIAIKQKSEISENWIPFGYYSNFFITLSQPI
jgi:hypothetical protein